MSLGPKMSAFGCVSLRGWRRSCLLLATVLVLAGLVGCFSQPTSAVASMICHSEGNCPVGYECRYPGVVGGCRRIGEPDPDAGSTDDQSPAHAEGEVSADEGALLDASASADHQDSAADSAEEHPYRIDSARDARDAALAGDAAIDCDEPPDLIEAAPAAFTPASSFSLVSGGTFCSSTSYRAVLSLAPPLGSTMILRSANFAMVGNLVSEPR